jgi:hypothetical protein
MTRASPSRLERRKRGAPKKEFSSDPDRGTIDVAEVLHLIGFGRQEAYDLVVGLREGRHLLGELGFELSGPVKGRAETLRQKCERESMPADSLRRCLLAARIILTDRARTHEHAIRALDAMLTIAMFGGVDKLRRAVTAMAGERRKRRRVARKTH